MLDLLWRTSFQWKLHPKQVTGDTAYGTTENIAAVEMAGIRAYVPLTGAGKARPYFSKEEFTYDPERDIYHCPAGEILAPKTFRSARNQILYKTEPGTCTSCSMRSQCTDNKTGRQLLRHLEERYVDRVKSYRGTFACEKALRKRRVWVEPLFGEAKDWHGLRRFRLRMLEKVNIEASADRLWTEHKEVNGGSGAGSAQVGSGGGLASTGSGEPLQVSSEWAVTYSCKNKGVFQQAVELSSVQNWLKMPCKTKRPRVDWRGPRWQHSVQANPCTRTDQPFRVQGAHRP